MTRAPGTTECGTLGKAMCALVATGGAASFEAAAQKMVAVEKTFTPNPAEKASYESKYETYKKCIEALAPLWLEL